MLHLCNAKIRTLNLKL